MKQHIFLIGFMGCGKSFWAKKWGQTLGFPFLDLDSEIEKKENKTIAAIFEKDGEIAFRIKEQAQLKQLEFFPQKQIVALGGGTPCFFDNMDWIKQHGIAIFLDIPISILVDRLLAESNKRPLIEQQNKTELRAWVEQKMEERRFFYEQATYIAQTEQELQAIIKKLIPVDGKMKV